MHAVFSLLFFAASVIATPVRQDEGNSLVVELLAYSDSVNTANDIKIMATVENKSNQEAKILKYGSVLDSENPTKSFKVTRNGNEVPFQGILLQLSTKLTDEAFITIPPGGKVTKTHSDLNGIYDFSSTGAGTYQFETLEASYAGSSVAKFASSPSVQVEVTSNTTRRDLLSKLNERAVLVCSNSAQATQIKTSFAESGGLADLAIRYIKANGANDPLFRSYFGAQTTDIPLTVFTKVATDDTDRKFSCSDPFGSCANDVIAYTVMQTGDIYPFFSEVGIERLCTDTTVADRNIRGATTLHELTHATSGTIDLGYGCALDIAMAAQDPRFGAANADNYNCFVTEVYRATQCNAH